MQTVTPSLPAARRRPVSAAVAVLTLASAVAAFVALTAGPTHAVGPVAAEAPLSELDGDITDVAGVLDEEGTAEVQSALDELAADTSYQLFVVYVERFDGLDGREWADATANRARLGTDDLLLAVATEDRLYGMSWDQNVDLTDGQLDAVRDAAVDRLRDDDWAGATVAAVDALLATTGGSGATTGTGVGQDDGGGIPDVVLWAAIGLVVVVGGFVLVRRARRRDAELAERGAAAAAARRRRAAEGARRVVGAAGRRQSAGPDLERFAGLGLEEMRRRAGSALVAVDDAVKTSEQELAFAEAEFGVEETREFRDALETARQEVAEAFHQRQVLEETPGNALGEHAELAAIITRCETAAASLDAQTDAFDELRRIRARAPEILDEAEQRATEITARVELARHTLAGLTATYPDTALASIRTNPDQAETLVANAREMIESGRAAVRRRRRAVAVADARAAQNALGQAVTLLEAVATAGDDLATAGSSLDTGIASITHDIGDADRLAPDDVRVRDAAAEARAAVDQARAAKDGGDPLAALSRLAAAEAALDDALAPSRHRSEADARARALLRDVLGRTESHLRSTRDYVTTRRGAVGPDARTRLAEAERLVAQAREQQASDPQAALATAQQAERYGQQAAQMAQQDTGGWDAGQGTVGSRRGADIGGMILGGILIDSMMRGGRRRGRRGGFGGFGGGGRGGFGGGFGGGGRGGFGGGFGGSGRGGAGGRF
ncbi:YgcG family protein [Isoptericola sp. b408]|uniref:TPM domain-containing protein n=1 Tax=Isoptericola sp. b408 TaxID=3064653 RepID=UPI0027125316|nr:TPM domain-containing protein [Isoptericola sp. b408]MDO8152279.1 TPM domain-containing protein [Isoptericola sp. b408]